MKSSSFHYHVPASVPEALRLLTSLADEDPRIIAGGQSLVPMMAFRMAQPAHLIDINNIGALTGLDVSGGDLHIGALVRHAQFGNPVVEGPLGALLSYVMHHIAHAPIRTRGTFCGSLAHADPASEWCLAAITLGASIDAQSERGLRTIGADELLAGLMSTTLEPDEIIVGVRIPLLPQATRFGFYEFSRRPGDYAMAMSLVTYEIENGLIRNARLGVGGAEDRPRRSEAAEAVLNGKEPGKIAFEAAANVAASGVEPMEDIQADASYRRDLVRVAVRRALEHSL
ncbi:MAG: FAD binding domain-containing protein [Xanthobacteraceae bacterium]|nr:FAD binding domain-containing protein [Xanthobacteraceae bacterium]